MASPALQSGQVIQVNLTGLFDAQHCVCTFHYAVTISGVLDTIPLAGLPAKWNGAFWADSTETSADGLCNLFMPGVTSVGIGAQIVFGPGARSLQAFTSAVPNTGQWPTGNPLTSGASLVIKRTGLLAGARYRGRIFTFGLPQALTVNSNINPAYDTQLTDIMVRLDQPLSYSIGGGTVTLAECLFNGTAFPEVAQIGVTHTWNSAVRYQRRREVGVGQ